MTYLVVLRKHLQSKYTDDYEQITLGKALTELAARNRLKELVEDLNKHRNASKIIKTLRNRWSYIADFDDFKARRFLFSFAIVEEQYGMKSNVLELSLMTTPVFEGDSILDYLDFPEDAL